MERWLKWGKELKNDLVKGCHLSADYASKLVTDTIIAYSALALILFVAFVIRILPLRWENLSGGTSLLNEFDPYYQFSYNPIYGKLTVCFHLFGRPTGLTLNCGILSDLTCPLLCRQYL